MNLAFLKTSRQSEIAASSDTASESIVDQIRRLGELRDSGLISAEQFRVRRAQLVGRSI
jgi:Short C-terminal domain